ncbi:MAG: putative bifunctional diguanylate cyclase/phosphodiesterase [Microthrixaceae bacterium]
MGRSPGDDPENGWVASEGAPDASRVLGELGDLVLVLDGNLRVAGANRTACSVLGRTAGELLGTPGLELVHPQDADVAADLILRFAAGAEMHRPGIRLRTDPPLAAEVVARRMDVDGNPHVIIGARIQPLVDHDVLLDGMGLGVVICDTEGVVTEANETAAQLLGVSAEQLHGPLEELPVRFLAEGAHGLVEVACPLSAVLAGEALVRERLVVETGGRRRVLHAEARPVVLRYSARAAAHLTLQDVTDRHHAEQELLRRAAHDDLTGLWNRSSFMARVDRALATRGPGTSVGLLFCDLDRFKSVNERFGHGEADALLMAFAARLPDALGDGWEVGRLGGDEFAAACVLPTDGATAMAELDERAAGLRSVARAVGLEVLHVAVTASVGVSLADDADGAADAARLVEEADEALRRAKRSGRDRARIFDTEMRAWRTQQTILAGLVRDHLEEGTLGIEVQPIVRAWDGAVVGGEALARLHGPGGMSLLASEWMEAATRSGLAAAVDEQVARLAAAVCGRLAATGRPDVPTVGINLADVTLARPDLAAWLSELLAAEGAPPGGLVLEIAETAFPVIRDRSVAALRELRATGMGIAIDDFGVGYASLAEVRDLPVDTLKIDRTFVTAEPDTAGAAILRASVEMARAMGCRTVAEGVESSAQMEWLRGLGVDEVQGYFVARPMAPGDFEALVAGG